jgi:hypothetical protein
MPTFSSPVTTFKTPAGNPASLAARAISSAVAGVFSAGFRMTVFSGQE